VVEIRNVNGLLAKYAEHPSGRLTRERSVRRAASSSRCVRVVRYIACVETAGGAERRRQWQCATSGGGVS